MFETTSYLNINTNRKHLVVVKQGLLWAYLIEELVPHNEKESWLNYEIGMCKLLNI